MFYAILFIYIPLLLKILFSVSRVDRFLRFIPLVIGKFEYFLAPLRDKPIAICLVIYSGWRFSHEGFELYSLLYAVFAALSFLNLFHRYRFRLALCRWVLTQDSVEPRQFFQIYDRCLGSFSFQIPDHAQRVNYSYVDYRTGNAPHQTLLPLFQGLIDTATLAKLAIFAMRKLPHPQGMDAFDAFARIWGVRFVQRARLKLNTTGVETMPPLSGKVLLVFNHKSHLDFALNFFALGNLRNGSRHLRPRFIAAKDHFIDNPIIYSFLGLGKCIEKAGMIFINRQKGKGWLAMQEAAQKLTESDVEVAVYPQGTRAWGLLDEKNRRTDAGYYTTFTSKKFQEMRGHLKSGTAQLILDAALLLREKGEKSLSVLFVGIDGTATVAPKGSFKIQTESVVTFHVNECWRFELPHLIPFENPKGSASHTEAHENYLDEIEAIHQSIDRKLQRSIARHTLLIDRVLNDPRISKPDKVYLEAFLKRADETENVIPFVTLDRLYALPHEQWASSLEHFTQLVKSSAEEESYKELIRKISSALIESEQKNKKK
ncbi:MAG: 1-acyl-sn-glycerol-3-phosphate acyltransferase [Deltaproteobacteria bacterium]|nr:1-acyl-sn-glycerol-3-phosphate acyltransferase [Deltaproteobacteria bacterium]